MSTERTRGLVPSGEQSPTPLPTSTRTCPLPVSAALGWAWSPRAPLALSAPALAVLTSGCEAARSGRKARPDPTGSAVGPSWGAGPPLAGLGAGRRGGCHESRALRNLGLEAIPSGGGGSGGSSSCALGPPARGGVCRPIPPPHSTPGPAAGPPPVLRRPPPTPLRRAAHASSGSSALAPFSAVALSPAPPPSAAT